MYKLITRQNMAEYSADIKNIEDMYYESTCLMQYIQEGNLQYIVYKKDGIIGGAKVVNPNDSHPITQYFKQHNHSLKDFWVLEDIFFDIPDDSPVHDDPELFDQTCKQFYTGLYDIIQLMGAPYGAHTCVTFNPTEEHEDVVFYGNWPFVTQHPIDDKIMGFLPLDTAQVTAA